MPDWAGEVDAGRTVAASLRFARGGGRTFVQHQRVPYPFHVTRPHFLHRHQPDMATLILQSASGGLYRGDRLRLDVSAGPDARAHLTSQAATVVHAAGGAGIAVDVQLRAGAGALLSVFTDPHILFPATALSVGTDITLDPGATLIVAEGFATHDPAGARRPFGRLATSCRVRRRDGALLVHDAGAIDGADFAGRGSPLGDYRAFGTVLLLGEAAAHLPAACLAGLAPGGTGVLGGATRLPNDAGVCVRLLADEGGPLARAMKWAWELGFAALTGHPPPPERRR